MLSVSGAMVLIYAQVVQEQLSRPEERRCPIAKASNEVTDLLSEHWAIYAPGCAYQCARAVASVPDIGDRLNLDNLPALLPQLLQGACARDAVLPPHVERERRVEGRLPPAHRAHTQPVRSPLSSFNEVRTGTDWVGAAE